MNLTPLPAFQDNYLWLLHDGQRALVVDPGDAGPVQAFLAEHGLRLDTILVTHHHLDHIGGVATLRQATGARVFGPAREQIPEPFTPLAEGEAIEVLGLRFEVFAGPGHTAGHIAYYCRDFDGAPLLFCGDTLFSGGCGRVFEGTPAQMLGSLDKLAALPGITRVCCTHEYTLGKLKFATAVEPGNTQLIHYQQQCAQRRSHGEPTLPSTIAVENSVNPFLRTRQPVVAQAAHRHDAAADPADPVAVFAALRQ